MMSWKSLHGLPSKWTNAFPTNEQVADIFVAERDVYNVLHYADYDGHSLYMLKRIAEALDKRVEIRFVPLKRLRPA